MEPAVPPVTGPAPRRVRRIGAPTPRVALVILATATLALVFLVAGGAVRPFILGILLVYLLAPPVERLASSGVPRSLAVLLVFLVAIGVVVIVGSIALAPLIRESRLFVEELPQIVADVQAALSDFYEGLNLSPEVRELIDHLVANAESGVGGLDLTAIVSPLVSSILGVVSTITAYMILPAWLFFLLRDRIRLGNTLEASLPASWRGDVFATFAIANRVFGKWVRGQLLLGATVGLASYIGLMVLSVVVDPIFGRYAVLLAIIAGLLELVPFIGPIIAAIPAVLIGLTVGVGGFVAAFLLYLGIQQVENNLLVPKIQGDAVELHPSAVMMSLVVGAALGGVLGAIVSLPIAAAGRDMFRYAFHRVGEPPASVAEALARVSPSLPGSLRPSVADGAAKPPAATGAGTGEPGTGDAAQHAAVVPPAGAGSVL